MSANAVPRRRDPERRRAEIVAATISAIAEHGLAHVSHRLIARRAGVPLGSTTYYFPTLPDLLAEALRTATEGWVRELREQWESRVPGDPVDAVLADLTATYLADRSRAITEYELYIASARDERLRPIATAWIGQMESLLAPLTEPARASAITMLVDGAMLQSLVTARPLDGPTLRFAIRELLGGG